MKIASVKNDDINLEIKYYSKKFGYGVNYRDEFVTGQYLGLQTKAAAEQEAIYQVGYRVWRAASEAAFQASKKEWLATHKTLESVGGEWEEVAR